MDTWHFGKREKVEQLVRSNVGEMVRVYFTGIGLGTKSPLTNIQAIRLGIGARTEDKVEVLERQ